MDPRLHIILMFLVGHSAVSGLFGFIGREQSVGIKGNLTCNGKPPKDVTLMLYDEDIFYDSLLEKEELDRSGLFELHGVKREISDIEPYLAIQHHCQVERGCHRMMIIKIPGPFVFNRSSHDVYYDMRNVDLSLPTIQSEIECHD